MFLRFGSSPTAPAIKKRGQRPLFFLCRSKNRKRHHDTRSVLRGAYASAAGGGKSEHKAAAAVEKSEEKREAPEGFFGHRKGISPTAPAIKKRGQRPLFFLCRGKTRKRERLLTQNGEKVRSGSKNHTVRSPVDDPFPFQSFSFMMSRPPSKDASSPKKSCSACR